MTALRLVVFAKAPVPGRVKTRLAPALGAPGAAAIAARMLQTTLGIALESKLGRVELRMDPAPGSADWHGLELPAGVALAAQGEGDLGERLARATTDALANHPGVVLLGTDCADLTVDLLRSAAASLSMADCVIYPATDGGYVLLGLRCDAPGLFTEMPWSTNHVAAETIRRCGALGIALQVGPTLRDVDGPEDLEHVPRAWLDAIGA